MRWIKVRERCAVSRMDWDVCILIVPGGVRIIDQAQLNHTYDHIRFAGTSAADLTPYYLAPGFDNPFAAPCPQAGLGPAPS